MPTIPDDDAPATPAPAQDNVVVPAYGEGGVVYASSAEMSQNIIEDDTFEKRELRTHSETLREDLVSGGMNSGSDIFKNPEEIGASEWIKTLVSSIDRYWHTHETVYLPEYKVNGVCPTPTPTPEPTEGEIPTPPPTPTPPPVIITIWYMDAGSSVATWNVYTGTSESSARAAFNDCQAALIESSGGGGCYIYSDEQVEDPGSAWDDMIDGIRGY